MRIETIELFIDILGVISGTGMVILAFIYWRKKRKEDEYRRYEQQWEYEEQQKQRYYQSREIKPGSAEHYEKWKAERENREP